MKLLILGATGPTGRHAVDLALRAGDSVTAFVRNPAALDDLADQVSLATGDATSHRDVSAAMAGQDAVVAALGRGRSVVADDFDESIRSSGLDWTLVYPTRLTHGPASGISD
ncbi:NAD(P)-binding oxidoreductase [Streptomyces sparsogenes]|uniref:NAD(P)-dependent oxidoreductase n=1 Tax=Streptomyces sparsogenes TaxID=67365 RepID=UPI00340D189A